jgi:hypothetical protein
MDIATGAMVAASSQSSSSSSGGSDGGNRAQSGQSQTSSEPKQAQNGQNQSSQNVPNRAQSGQKEPSNHEAQPSVDNTLYEYTVNGKTYKGTIDQIKAKASLAHAADEKFQEAARIRKMMEQREARERAYKENPLQALIDYSKDMNAEQRRELLEAYYSEHYLEPEMLTAEQRRIKELEQYKARVERERQEFEKQQRQQQEQELTAKELEVVQKKIIDTLDKSDLPKTKYIVQRMAFYMRQALLNGWEAPMEVIVDQIQEERQAILSDILNSASIDQVSKMFGDEFMNKLRRHDLEKYREGKRNREKPFALGADSSQELPDKVGYDEVSRRLRDMRTGKFSGWG